MATPSSFRTSALPERPEAERLPFKVESFDCVFHVGGINFFTDKARAIKEMIWVAKSGTKIVIVDETERTIRENYQRTNFNARSSIRAV